MVSEVELVDSHGVSSHFYLSLLKTIFFSVDKILINILLAMKLIRILMKFITDIFNI